MKCLLRNIIFTVAVFFTVFYAFEAKANVTQVDVIAASSGTDILTDGNNYYYPAGGPYTFDVQVQSSDPDFTTLTDVRLIIPSTTNIEIQFDASGGVGGPIAATIISGGGSATGEVLAAGTSANFTVRFSYTVTATTSEIAVGGPRTIDANATSTLGGGTVNATTTQSVNYGIVAAGIDAGNVTVTSADAGDTYATQNGYYRPTGAFGSTAPYDFTVQIASVDGHDWSCVSNVTLTLTSGVNITLSVTPPAAGGSGIAVTEGGGDATGVATADFSAWTAGGTNTVTFHYTPSTSVSEIARGAHDITASAKSVFDVAAVDNTASPLSHTYGIVASGIDAGNVTVTSADAGDTYATQNGYYRPTGAFGSTAPYDFTVQIASVDGHDWSCVSNVTLTLTSGVNITLSVTPPAAGGSGIAVTEGGGDAAGVATADFSAWTAGGTNTVTFHYTPSTSVSEIARGAHDITASAKSVFDAAAVDNTASPLSHTYGIVAAGIDAGNVTVTSADAGDTYATQNGYYINSGATVPYDFTVQIASVDGHDWSCVSNVTLTLTSGVNITLSVTPPAAGGSGIAVTEGGGDAAGVATADFSAWTAGGTNTVTFHYTPSTSVSEIARGAHDITASAKSVFDAASVDNTATPLSHTYGIVASGVNSVDLSALQARTTLSTTDDYYLPNRSYTFTVDVTADGHDWTCVTLVQVNIPTGAGDVILTVNPDAMAGTPAVTVAGGDTAGTATSLISGVDYNDFTVTFTYTPSWNVSEKTVGAANITASAQTVFDAAATADPTPTNITYGISSTVKVLMAQSGSATDGFVNPWTDTFNVTGNIVYNIAGATAADIVQNTDVTANIELLFDIDTDTVAGYESTNVDSTLDDVSTNSTFTVVVPADWFSANGQANNGIGTYNWKIRSTVGGTVQTLAPATALTLVCDRVEILDMQFQNGGGVNNDPTYNRNIYLTGTQVRVQLGMQYQGGNCPSNLNVVLSYDYPGANPAQTTNVTLTGGSAWTSWGDVVNPVVGDVAVGNTITFNSYQVSSILDPAGVYNGGTGQNAVGRIVQDPAPLTIYWDNADPPGSATPFVAGMTATPTADTITLTWTGLPAIPGPGEDDDFSSYRIYYRTTSPVGSWYMIDSSIDVSLANPTTSTYTITNLQALTSYDYYVTAVDVFGNEVLQANAAPNYFAASSTSPSTTTVSISDGIVTYEDSSFTSDPLPSSRPLRKTSIKVDVNLVGASQPEQLNIILADDALATNLITGGSIDGGLTINTDYYRIAMTKTAPNTWTGFIPTTNPLIVSGQDSKFILEAVKSGTNVYYDHDSEAETAPGNPNDYEWTFTINQTPIFTPWPVRVLNNVITDKNPKAYPSYYLTENANVTIKVYDVKGRVVKVLLDNASRKAGQNIKENGWDATNKAGRKVGVGLYYIYIKAETSSGKVVINKINKVVVAQ